MKLTVIHLSKIEDLMKNCNVSEVEVFELRGRVRFVLTFGKQASLLDQVVFEDKLEKIVGEKIITFTKDSLKLEVELFNLSQSECDTIITNLTPLKKYVEKINTETPQRTMPKP